MYEMKIFFKSGKEKPLALHDSEAPSMKINSSLHGIHAITEHWIAYFNSVPNGYFRIGSEIIAVSAIETIKLRRIVEGA